MPSSHSDPEVEHPEGELEEGEEVPRRSTRLEEKRQKEREEAAAKAAADHPVPPLEPPPAAVEGAEGAEGVDGGTGGEGAPAPDGATHPAALEGPSGSEMIPAMGSVPTEGPRVEGVAAPGAEGRTSYDYLVGELQEKTKTIKDQEDELHGLRIHLDEMTRRLEVHIKRSAPSEALPGLHAPPAPVAPTGTGPPDARMPASILERGKYSTSSRGYVHQVGLCPSNQRASGGHASLAELRMPQYA